MAEPVKSDLRRARTARTEALLVEAASELFVARGYAATTLAEVAAHAGLAPRTLYLRFATKADLLLRCLDVAIGGDAEPVTVADRSWIREAMTAPTLDERIRRMASITATLMARAGPLLGVAQQAAATEPAVAAAAQAGRDDTARTLAEFWRRMADDRLLPPGSDLGWLTDTGTLLAHAETYLLLTRTTAWGVATYQAWLETTWRRLVAASAAGGVAPGRRRR